MPCPGCDALVRQSDLEWHMNQCPMAKAMVVPARQHPQALTSKRSSLQWEKALYVLLKVVKRVAADGERHDLVAVDSRLARRLGYGDAADQIQDLYLSGKKSEAEALVPNELLDEVSLVGPRERIIERLGPWKEAGKRGEVGSMLLGVQDPVVLELLANEML